MPGPGSYRIGEEERKEVLEVLDSGSLFRYGSFDDPKFLHKSYTFEQEFARYCGVEHALLTSSGTSALLVALMGLGWITILVGLTPRMARVVARRGRRLLAPGPETDLSLRVAELTATRAAALDAHATELRRIERSLHDGTQNRVVAVTVLVGAARRKLHRRGVRRVRWLGDPGLPVGPGGGMAFV